MEDKQCKHHQEKNKDVKASTEGCEECLKEGTRWVQLRVCLVCGHVGCCDSSVGKHATKHFHTTNHSVMQAFEEGSTWEWCYVDEEMFDPGIKEFTK